MGRTRKYSWKGSQGGLKFLPGWLLSTCSQMPFFIILVHLSSILLSLKMESKNKAFAGVLFVPAA